jgi:hypothetical protein
MTEQRPHSNARPATDGWRGGAAYFFSLVVVVVVDVDAAAGGGAVVVVVVDEVVVGSDGLTPELPPPHATPTADTAARTTRPITFFILSPPRTAFWTHPAASVKQKRDSAWMLVHDASQVPRYLQRRPPSRVIVETCAERVCIGRCGDHRGSRGTGTATLVPCAN